MRIATTPKTPRQSRPTALRCFVLLVALFYGWMAHSSLVSTAHDHDEPATDSNDPANPHGQHSADHSHDKPNLKRSHHQAVMKPPRFWASIPHCVNYPEPCFAFERPPKQLLQA